MKPVKALENVLFFRRHLLFKTSSCKHLSRSEITGLFSESETFPPPTLLLPGHYPPTGKEP